MTPAEASPDTCAFDECGRSTFSRGLCVGHYRQQWLGKPLTPLRRLAKKGEPMAWLREAVQRETDDCIEWPYARSKGGYGYVGPSREKVRRAHVIALNLIHPWHPPYGPHALHSCDNPACVNPAHLSWGTHAENMRQRFERGHTRGLFAVGGRV